ncbi:hypothetical protein P8452_11864 [Trifolium repens]|nr:hypothetical protein P8452_11864 [Trifolium repens]
MVAESPTSVCKEPPVMLLFSNNPTLIFESMGENPDACTMDNAKCEVERETTELLQLQKILEAISQFTLLVGGVTLAALGVKQVGKNPKGNQESKVKSLISDLILSQVYEVMREHTTNAAAMQRESHYLLVFSHTQFSP